MTLEEAYRRLALIRRNRHPYPGWALTTAAGGLAGAASVLLGGGLWVFLIAAAGAMLGDRLAWLAAGRGLPEFYQFAVAAVPPAALGVAVSLLHWDLRPSAVITGGLFALIPGRALVAAVQDGLTGFYITASARLLEVAYFFVAIVVGVLTALYVSAAGRETLNPEGTVAPVERPGVQIAAAMVLSLTFAVLLQQERSTVLFAMLNGAVAWVVFAAIAMTANGSAVLATAVAAGLVGLFGQLRARYEHTSSLPYVTAAIGPLLPGSATYYGVLIMAQNRIDAGFASLARAAALALAIAIGVNLGGELARMFLRAPGSAAARRAAKRTRASDTRRGAGAGGRPAARGWPPCAESAACAGRLPGGPGVAAGAGGRGRGWATRRSGVAACAGGRGRGSAARRSGVAACAGGRRARVGLRQAGVAVCARGRGGRGRGWAPGGCRRVSVGVRLPGRGADGPGRADRSTS